MNAIKLTERKVRAKRLLGQLKKMFPDAQIELRYHTPWELLVAVMLSAQCTDARVNEVTKKLFKKYKNFEAYLKADPKEFEEDIRSTGFYRAKTKNILAAARKIQNEFGGKVPRTMEKLITLPGVARKTANIVLGQVYGVIEGIAVDTHVRRFAIKFDLSDHTDPVKIERDLMEIIPQKDWFVATYWIIEYGRKICPARPHPCADHPLSKIFPEAARTWPKAK